MNEMYIFDRIPESSISKFNYPPHKNSGLKLTNKVNTQNNMK